jgi:hypothetical protein
MENKDKDFVNDFMKKLREAAASTERKPTPTDPDMKIKNTIRYWWKTENKAYQRFIDRPKTDIEYFANHFAKAGIGLKDGWEYTKQTLRGYIDAESLEDGGDRWKEYEAEYNRTRFRQSFRDKIVNY